MDTELSAGISKDSNMTHQFKKPNNYFDGLPLSKKQLLVFVIIIFGLFFEQLDQLNFSFISAALIDSWHIDEYTIGRINSAFYIGMMLGGLFGGMITDFLGRRKSFLASLMIVPVASIINGITSNLTVFLLCRAVTGFGILFLMVVATTYISEISPKEIRGKVYNRAVAVGFLAMPAIGIICRAIIPINEEAWRYIFYIGGLGLLPFLLAVIYLKESPRWLVSKGRIAEAEEICHELTGIPIDLSEVSKNIPKKIKTSETIFGMFGRKYIKRSIVFLLANVFLALSIINISLWVPTLLKQSGFDLQTSLTVGMLLQFGVPAGNFLSSFFTDKGGRKIPLGIFLLLSSGAAALFALTGHSAIMAAILGLTVTLFMNCTNFTMNSYVLENYPTNMRSTSFGLISSVARLSVAGSQFAIPAIAVAYGFRGVFSSVSLLFLMTAVLILLFGARTGGKSLEEIQ